MRILKERYPTLVMLMNTVYDDDERIFQALCAGASGYLLKKTPPAKLLKSTGGHCRWRTDVTGSRPAGPGFIP